MSVRTFIRHSIFSFFLIVTIASFNACIKETNNSYGTAVTITDGQVVEDKFTDNDARFYAFELSAACLVKVTVDKSPGRIQLKVFDTQSENSVVVGTDWIEQGQDIVFWAGPLSPGEHYIAVYPTYRYDSSDLNFKFKIEYDCSDATELNNSFDRATPLPVDAPFEGKILAVNDYYGYEDVDMYKFEVTDKYAVVKVTFKAPNNIYSYFNNNRIQVTAYNIANETSELDEMEVEEGQVDEMLFGSLAPGTHYIAVNYDGQCNCQSDEPYTLTVELDYDKNEPNDGPTDQATPMNLDEILEGKIVFPNERGFQDEDWFKFTPLQSGAYQLSLIAPTGSNNFYTYAYVYGEANDNIPPDGYIYATNGGTATWPNATWPTPIYLSASETKYIKVVFGNTNDESPESYKIKIAKI